jgi:predicted DNA binding CopG/RHH family protein
MVIKMSKKKIDRYEREIENLADSFVPVKKKKRQKIDSLLEKERKTKNINIRISAHALEKLKEKSVEEGLPYQTLISQILHKYISDSLVDEKEIMKALELMEKVDSSVKR